MGCVTCMPWPAIPAANVAADGSGQQQVMSPAALCARALDGRTCAGMLCMLGRSSPSVARPEPAQSSSHMPSILMPSLPTVLSFELYRRQFVHTNRTSCNADAGVPHQHEGPTPAGTDMCCLHNRCTALLPLIQHTTVLSADSSRETLNTRCNTHQHTKPLLYGWGS